MKASEIRDLSTDAIRTRINDSQEELMRLRFQQATGELTDHSRVRQIRRRVARLLTILNEREQAARMEGE
ncbi:MAG TPA: 50S ribosomal protein L29 [Bacillota bacterium]|jgi:large subunit ribosomal protein L29|nr:50S ribosomal protein L29 [Bacillota bacterium]